ncbi:amino acid ABC transporter substrate-binding protein [Vibrio sp. 99-8-1]|nr:amino acid ABC transporter substrate-binding protein [Vibrio sp. 99-8-1]
MRYLPLRQSITILFISLFSSLVSAETFHVMLHTGSFPPYFFEEDDARTGTIKDIYSAIAEETGDTFEYVRVPFNRALHKFEVGEIDIEPMTNPAYRGKSKVIGVYSIPFTVAEEVILFNSDHHIRVNGPDDLLDKTVGVIKGYHYPKFSHYFNDGRIKTSSVKNENILIKLLLAGRFDQALINKDFAQYEIQQQHINKRVVVGKTYNSLDMMLRLHPNKEEALPRFNKAIDKLVKDGTIEKIYDRYR